jgi:hypothetical protein
MRSLRRDAQSSSQVLQRAGRVYQSTPAFRVDSDIGAARLLCSTGIAPLRRYYEPSRRRLVFGRFPGRPGYTAYLAPPSSRRDEDGFSSCSTCPCHRAAPNHPAGAAGCLGQPTACPYCLRPTLEGSASGVFFCRGHHWVHFRCGPVTRSPSRGWLGRSASSVSFPPRMRSKLRRFLTFPPVGLSPTEHVCLVRTHCLPVNMVRLESIEVAGVLG